ncbi:MAG: helix-hairpin-helix domain-containing protein [Oscillospiraceae bacterium]|nr:helix-hairpin-helix domain-containing protein [Oscillospiraceae bacterium]
MKKASRILIIMTIVVCAFAGGFFLGRNCVRSDIRLSAVSTTVPTEATLISATTAPVLMDINTASAADLATLPGIGSVLAQRIVDYRVANGSFTSIQELLNVEDIGEKRLADILDFITVGGST